MYSKQHSEVECMRIKKWLLSAMLLLLGFATASCRFGDTWRLNRREENELYAEAILFVRSLTEDENFLYTAENTSSNLIVTHVDGVFESLEENDVTNQYYFDGILYTRIPESSEIATSPCDFATLDYLASVESMRDIIMYIFAEANIDEIIEDYSGIGHPWEIRLSFSVDSELLRTESLIDSDTTIDLRLFEYGDGRYVIELSLEESSGNQVLRINSSRDLAVDPIQFPEDITTTSVG
jgi:hypothetical protein